MLPMIQNLAFIALVLFPGFYIRNILNYINPKQILRGESAIVSALMYSLLHFIAWSWLTVFIFELIVYNFDPWFIWPSILFILSLFTATLTAYAIGFIHKTGFLLIIPKLISLKIIDPTETVWDRLFSKTGPLQLLITLKDGEQICGLYAEKSFPFFKYDDRDIFVQNLNKKGEDGNYSYDPSNLGSYIPKDSIKYIKILSHRTE
jgi:hypothetical protein